jgi:hypothetical protein
MEPLPTEFIREQVALFVENATPEALAALSSMAGVQTDRLPEDMALINELLDALPDAMANEILVEYFNDLYV